MDLLPSQGAGFFTMRCSLSGPDFQTQGFAEGWRTGFTARKAFAEAWERYWMRVMAQEDSTIESSNGFASGSTAAQAQAHAVAELEERETLRLAWTAREGWVALPWRSLRARWILAGASARGWSSERYRVGACEFGRLVHPVYGSAFDGTSNTGEVKLAMSLVRQARVLERMSVDPEWRLPEEGKPVDHLRFYRDPRHQRAFDFLKEDPSRAPRPYRLESDRIRTRVLFEAGEFPAVARATHPEWPVLRWGRRSQEGPWPHPLA